MDPGLTLSGGLRESKDMVAGEVEHIVQVTPTSGWEEWRMDCGEGTVSVFFLSSSKVKGYSQEWEFGLNLGVEH